MLSPLVRSRHPWLVCVHGSAPAGPFRRDGKTRGKPGNHQPCQNGLVDEPHFGGFPIEPVRPDGFLIERRPSEVRPRFDLVAVDFHDPPRYVPTNMTARRASRLLSGCVDGCQRTTSVRMPLRGSLSGSTGKPGKQVVNFEPVAILRLVVLSGDMRTPVYRMLDRCFGADRPIRRVKPGEFNQTPDVVGIHILIEGD
jgi:hypothetical protein